MYKIGLGRGEDGRVGVHGHLVRVRTRMRQGQGSTFFLLTCFVPRPYLFLAPAHSMRDSGSPSRSRCTACD
jgi:hypothetical protein